jgi:proteasome beta subunit
MELLPLRAGDHSVTAADDFATLLRRLGHLPAAPAAIAASGHPPTPVEATTILAFKFAGGVLVAGDRRATAGNLVVYDRADKVLEIDRHSLMAIAGVPATAWEMARVLEHSFQFYRRSQLQEMSLDGKVRALSKLLRDNLGFVLQGVGVVVPIFATYDVLSKVARLYFYDAWARSSRRQIMPSPARARGRCEASFTMRTLGAGNRWRTPSGGGRAARPARA